MPLTMTPPDEFMRWKDRVIYHVYREMSDDRREYWYGTCPFESNDFEFDVRDLPVPPGTDGKHELVIQSAIDSGLIQFPEHTETTETPVIKATAWSDNRAVEVEFNAGEYFTTAYDDEIMGLAMIEWRGDVEADQVALYYEDRDYRLANLFHYIATTDLPEDFSGFECAVDEESAMSWLRQHRGELYWKIRVAQGTAVAIEAHVEETLTISKFATTHVEPEKAADEEAVLDAAHSAIYDRLAVDMESGWASESSAHGELSATVNKTVFTRAV